MTIGSAIQENAAEKAARLLPLFAQVQVIHAAVCPDHVRADMDEEDVLDYLRRWFAHEGPAIVMAVALDGSDISRAMIAVEVPKGTPLKQVRRVRLLHHVVEDRDCDAEAWALALTDGVEALSRRTGITQLTSLSHAFNNAFAALMRKAGLAQFRIAVHGPV